MCVRSMSTSAHAEKTTRSILRFVRASDALSVRHAPFRTIASQIRPVRASAYAPMNPTLHTLAPRNRVKTVCPRAASPAITWVSHVLTSMPSCTAVRRVIPPSIAVIVKITIATPPIAAPSAAARRGRRCELPTTGPHPLAVERRRDDQARRATADPWRRFDERLREAELAAGLDLRQELHDLAELLRAPVGLHDLGPVPAGDEADTAVLTQGLRDDR